MSEPTAQNGQIAENRGILFLLREFLQLIGRLKPLAGRCDAEGLLNCIAMVGPLGGFHKRLLISQKQGNFRGSY